MSSIIPASGHALLACGAPLKVSSMIISRSFSGMGTAVSTFQSTILRLGACRTPQSFGHFFSCHLELIWFRDHGPHLNSLTEFKAWAASGYLYGLLETVRSCLTSAFSLRMRRTSLHDQ